MVLEVSTSSNNKKYEFTGERTHIMEDDGSITYLYRIRALRDIDEHYVKKGDLGGWINDEHNLSFEDDSWIGVDGYVLDQARVSENALVEKGSIIRGKAHIKGFSKVIYHTRVGGQVLIQDNATVTKSEIKDSAVIRGICTINDSTIKDCATIIGSSIILNKATIEGNARLEDVIITKPNTSIGGYTKLIKMTIRGDEDGNKISAY